MLEKTLLWVTLGMSLLVVGCAPRSAPPIAPPVIYSAVQHRVMPPFTRIKVDGPISVALHTGDARPQVILHGDPRDLAAVTTMVVNSMLQINIGKGYPKFGGIHAEIRGKYLNAFIYHGVGTITGNNLRSSLLDLSIANEGKTTLQGQMVLRSLEVSGNGYTQISTISSPGLRVRLIGAPRVKLAGVVNLTSLDMDSGWLSMYWVKSKLLTIRGKGAALIQLAGVVDKLDVELCDKARFNGRYLRSNITFVKTFDQSLAEITTIDKQHTLASGNSDIHFYKIPKMKTDFMAFNGAVLDMRDLRSPFVQEYNRYNK